MLAMFSGRPPDDTDQAERNRVPLHTIALELVPPNCDDGRERALEDARKVVRYSAETGLGERLRHVMIPGMIAMAWFALVAPPRTPPEIAAKLSATVAEILRMPEIVHRFSEVGADPVGNTPEEMAIWMKEDTERWRAVIKAGNIRVD